MAALVSGTIRSSGDERADRHPDVVKALRRVVVAGLLVQAAGREATEELETEIEVGVRALAVARRFARRWRKAVVRGGAQRRERLQLVWETAQVQWIGRGCVPEAWARARAVRAPTLGAALLSWQEAKWWWSWRAAQAARQGRLGLASALWEDACRAGVMWRLGGGRRACRARAAAEYRAGRQANAWQHWAVERVLSVRIPDDRRGRQLMVTVRWRGDWADDEISITQLVSASLKADARRMEAALLAERDRARAPKRTAEPTRVQPARAGVERAVRRRGADATEGGGHSEVATAVPIDAAVDGLPIVHITPADAVWTGAVADAMEVEGCDPAIPIVGAVPVMMRVHGGQGDGVGSVGGRPGGRPLGAEG